MTRKCCKCHKNKNLKDFHKDPKNPLGRAYACKPCHNKICNLNRRKKRKIFNVPQWEIDKNNLDDYIAYQCDVCTNTFYPTKKLNTVCPICRVTTEKIYHSISVNSEWGKKSKRVKVLRTDLIEIAKKFLATDKCKYCCRIFTETNIKTLDHIIPKSLDFSNSHKNINICCWECNRSKGELLLNDWVNLCSLVYQASTGVSSGSAEL